MPEPTLIEIARARRLAALASVNLDQSNLFATIEARLPKQRRGRQVAIFASSRSAAPEPTPRLRVIGGQQRLAA